MSLSEDRAVGDGSQSPSPAAPPDRTVTLAGSAQGAPQREEPLPRGAAVGRYLLLHSLGTGGMGVVYAAYDPELDRKIAIKLVRAESASPAAQSRLLREAQAMAQLSDANVIAIHDVGTFGDRVFLAMELVEGGTLRDWMREPRPLRDILRMFIAAGRGLAAAHSAGLVHRDFKPDNVLVGNDGRVRVTDFGLARAAASVLEGETPSSRLSGDEALTATGFHAGTPVYMAPEQLEGRTVDARTDQFSFCVALYEALHGERPFAGSTREEIQRAIRAGLREPSARAASVPAWLRRILRRGLAADPAQRFPSMDALLSALSRDPASGRRRAAAGLGVVALVGVAILGGRQATRQQAQLCRGAESKLAGVWDTAVKAKVEAAFLASQKPFATDAFQRVQRALDSYAGQWASMRTEACEATRLRGEQSEELLDRRMICLEQRRQELGALASLFVRADAQVVEKSIEAASSLGGLAACADAAALMASLPPPRDDVTRARVEKARVLLANAKALFDTQRPKEALEAARLALAAARESGYAPIEAEALYRFGEAQALAFDNRGAEQSLIDAVRVADANRHDEIRARALLRFADLVGNVEARFDQGELWLEAGTAAIDRLERSGARTGELAALAALTKGRIREKQGKLADAVAALEQARAERARVFGPDHPLTAQVDSSLALVLVLQGRYEDALARAERALATAEKASGPAHPDVADALLAIGRVDHRSGKRDEAVAALRRGLSILEAAYGPDNPRLAETLLALGTEFSHLKKVQEALALKRRALALAERYLGPDHLDTASYRVSVAVDLRKLGRLEEAAEEGRRGVAAFEKSGGPAHPKLDFALYALGDTLMEQKKYAEALSVFQRSLAVGEKAFGADHPTNAQSLLSIAEALAKLGRRRESIEASRQSTAMAERTLAKDNDEVAVFEIWNGENIVEQGEPAEAIAPLERALALRERNGARSLKLAKARFALARALAASGRDRARAAALAAQAREPIVLEGDDEDRAKLKTWSARFGWR